MSYHGSSRTSAVRNPATGSKLNRAATDTSVSGRGVSRNPLKSSKTPEITTVSTPQSVRITERYTAGQSIREISREEGRARETVPRIVRSSEMTAHASRLRERLYGLGDHAVAAVEHALRQDRDAQLGYRLLMDLGVVPSPGERQPLPVKPEAIDRESLNPYELAMAEDENGQINGMSLQLARMVQARSNAYGYKLQTPDELHHNRMVFQAIDEATGGHSLYLNLSNPAKWKRLKDLLEEKLREFKAQTQQKEAQP